MVREQLVPNGISDPGVLEVMARIPRHLFLDGDMGSEAYSEHSFPIGYSQTMSQPYMVAYLTEQLSLTGEEIVLEIGTGSGYQAAVLAQLSRRVYSIERIEPLAKRARMVLGELGISNVEIAVADGSRGWIEKGPFDRILATAAAADVPETLLHQLRDGACFLGPVVTGEGRQEIARVTRVGTRFRLERLKKCSFVPLVRENDGK
jgi:protein-L-isoaspartate(D-aspartate) O-methyltransferase